MYGGPPYRQDLRNPSPLFGDFSWARRGGGHQRRKRRGSALTRNGSTALFVFDIMSAKLITWMNVDFQPRATDLKTMVPGRAQLALERRTTSAPLAHIPSHHPAPQATLRRRLHALKRALVYKLLSRLSP